MSRPLAPWEVRNREAMDEWRNRMPHERAETRDYHARMRLGWGPFLTCIQWRGRGSQCGGPLGHGVVHVSGQGAPLLCERHRRG
ncbi:hypothetical protein [Myxococcus landrumensis]|uniref:Uncharacterized protein n=1 Tax=Myxococcus landrumensis TaxID=2813577 RepID=A0ABX7N9C7_9BACT|nr:hypothetical protein [Myxococcus landrumus]QSQ14026.1 hypothetical protein JY572_37890 [Myxococcus landrumus]